MFDQLETEKKQLNWNNFFSNLIISQSIFEDNLERIERKHTGIFFTNEIDIIDNINSIVPINNEILSKKIFEPSCGQGIFILRLLLKIYEKFPQKEIIDKFIENNVVFVDNSPKMVDITKFNIKSLYSVLFNKPYNGSFNGYEYDFTKKVREDKYPLLGIRDINHPLIQYLEKIDYIIGNPPYVTLYGRRDKKTDEAQRIYYLNNYKQFPDYVKNGKINLIMLFLEHSLDFLKQGGQLSFIIDISFFETAYQYTRKYLLEKTNIISMDINIARFDVASGQLILKLRKEKPDRNNLVQIANFETGERKEIKQSTWNKPDDEYKFRISQDPKTAQIIGKIDASKSKTLKELYPQKNLRTCVMLLNMEEKFIFTKDNLRNNMNIYPYYQGSQGLKEKYGIFFYTKYFYYDKALQDRINEELKEELTKKGIKNKKRLGLGETVIYNNPKVYIRQSAKEIIASYDERKSSANNSIYVFSLRSNSDESRFFLKFLCGLLNSDLITFYAQKNNIIRYSKGKQPQIKTSDLYTIKIPQDKILQTKVSMLVSKIYENRENKDNLNEIINKLIFDYYNIDSEEIKFIRESIKAL